LKQCFGILELNINWGIFKAVSEIIHDNITLAKSACEQYIKAIYELQSTLGVWEENEDSCSATFTYAEYRDEMGNLKKYCL
jgi:hypothetical protein